MKVDLRSVVGPLGGLARVAIRSYLTTLLLFVVVGVALAAGSYHFLRDHSEAFAGAAGALALIEAVAAGVFLAGRRAVAAVVGHALGSFRLGGKLVQGVFDRMPGLDGPADGGEKSPLARGLERLPLAQAEQLLTAAVTRAIGDAAAGGWVRRLIQARLLGLVQRYTLHRFREEGAGGVDVRKVRDELVRTVDDRLADRVRGGAIWWTGAGVIGLTAVAAAQTGLLMALAQRHP